MKYNYSVVTEAWCMAVQIYLCSSPFFADILIFLFSSGPNLQVEDLTSQKQDLTEGLFLQLLSDHIHTPRVIEAAVFTYLVLNFHFL